MNIHLSGIVITKNEEKRIKECLMSLSICDEIIVVDGGSSDKTVEIAKQMNAKVVLCNTNDYSEMRNAGLKRAEGEWVLYIDADERVSSLLREEIKKVVLNNHTHNVYALRRKNYYLGANPWPYEEKLERLFKKEKLERWYGELHESPKFSGTIGILTHPLYHYSHRTISSMVEKTNRWSNIEAKLRYDHNHPEMTWWRFPRVMTTAFIHSYIFQGGWKAGTVGIIESIYQAFSMFITYAKLWELQNKKK